jgi:hypothetical protein
MAFKSLEESKEIRILQTDKGKCIIVLKESMHKMSSLLEPGVCKFLCKEPTFQNENMQMLLAKNKLSCMLAGNMN